MCVSFLLYPAAQIKLFPPRITAQITSSSTLHYTLYTKLYIVLTSNAAFLLSPSSQRVYIVTWNVGSAVPPDDITALFGPNVSDGSVDMFIIG